MTLEELLELIQTTTNKPISSLVENQITKFNNQGFSYKEIGRAFYYFYVIQNKNQLWDNFDKFGIGIVPTICEQANAYYDHLAEETKLKTKAAIKLKENDVTVIQFKPNRRSFRKKEIDINEL